MVTKKTHTQSSLTCEGSGIYCYTTLLSSIENSEATTSTTLKGGDLKAVEGTTLIAGNKKAKATSSSFKEAIPLFTGNYLAEATRTTLKGVIWREQKLLLCLLVTKKQKLLLLHWKAAMSK